MQIIQLSDLHIAETTDINLCKAKIDKLYDSVRNKIIKDKTLVIINCGDIRDSSSANGYTIADNILCYMKYKFSIHNPYYEFVPGNHDITSNCFDKYDMFIDKYITGDKYKYTNTNTILRKYGTINIVLTNSSHHNDHTYGKIDSTELKRVLSRCSGNTVSHLRQSRRLQNREPLKAGIQKII